MKRLVLLALPALAATITACGADVSAVTSLTGDATAGKTLYANSCNGCHGPDGMSGSTKRNIANAIKNEGDEAVGVILNGDDDMPAFATTLSSQQIADIVAYVKTL